jgi:hypothetical protein
MPKGILQVESRPNSPEDAAGYHEWYGIHMKEISAIPGVVSARRFVPLDEDGPFIALYELDADDLDAVRAEITEATRLGRLTKPVGLQIDPPPTVRYSREFTP